MSLKNRLLRFWQVAILAGGDRTSDLLRLPPSRRDGKCKRGTFRRITDPKRQSAPTVTTVSDDIAVRDIEWRDGYRKFTIGELKRICGFPDDYRLVGSYAKQWARLGDSVPPVMMRHIAEAIRSGVFRHGQTE